VESGCESIQQALTEVAGEVGRLGESERVHVASCSECEAVGSAERALGALLEQVQPPAGPDLTAAVLEALPKSRLRRRLVALIPVAASLAVAVFGVAMVGGVPGAGLLALLPVWSSQAWLALAGAAGDLGVTLVATARAAHSLVPTSVLLLSVALALVGVVSTVTLAARWRKSTLWRRNH